MHHYQRECEVKENSFTSCLFQPGCGNSILIDPKVWLEIADRARSLGERWACSISAPGTTESETVEATLNQWCQVVAQGEGALFERRLAWDGLERSRLRSAIAAPYPAGADLPGWIATLQAVVSLERPELAMGDRCLKPDAPLPFEDILLPFVWLARQRLAELLPDRGQQLTETALAQLEYALLVWLSYVAAQPLYLEFSVFRGGQQPDPAEPTTTEAYQAFGRSLQAGGLLPFLQEYSALARLLALITEFWIANQHEFLQHLAADRAALERLFGPDLGQVVALEPGLSDRHHQGRSVIAVTFASGRKLAYKPRDLGLEVAYFQLLDWLNQRQAPLPFHCLKVLNRQTHGWVEWVPAMPCQTPEQVDRYYQRTGMLLCLLYALEGTDCHRENLVAWGEHPVLVDMEALLHHRPREATPHQMEQAGADQAIWNSVLRVGLLPQWQVGPGGQSYDGSALGGVGGQETPFRVPDWQRINTDQMTLSTRTVRTRACPNLPSLQGNPVTLEAYHPAIAQGFTALYRFLLEQRQHLLAQDGPLTAFANQPVRFIFRPTRIYDYLRRKTLHPRFLRCGIDRSLQFDLLSKALLSGPDRHPFWPLLALERAALENLDIPLFTAIANEDSLTVLDRRLEQCFEQSGYGGMLDRLRQFSETDLHRQLSFIRGALYAYMADGKGMELAGSGAAMLSDPLPIGLESVKPSPTDAELLAQARAIAVELEHQAIQAADGSLTWVALTFLPQAQKFQFQPIGHSLYDGRCGISLFLAALAHVTQSDNARHLALAALQPLLHALANPAALLAQIGLGGATGMGSVIYSLVKVGQFLQDPGLIDLAHRSALSLTADSIQADRTLDVLSGSAGTLLGLLALYQVMPEAAVLQQAIGCGEHLLQQRQLTPSGHRAWVTFNQRPLTGFSHGAAGIALALLRLHAVTGDERLRSAAMEAIAYENSLFSPEQGNWPDLRWQGPENPTYPVRWCHGATGIALARLGCLPLLNPANLWQDIQQGLSTTARSGRSGLDNLCCGQFGRVELLLEAGRRLSQPELIEAARERALWVMGAASQADSFEFQLFSQLPRDAYNPGFFQGTAGIGYSLLRLAAPVPLPLVLLWE